MSTVYLNGEYLPKEEARVPVDDRGFLLSDGVYEVTPAYRGRFFRLRDHIERMRRGLAALRIDFDPDVLVEIHERLLEENGLTGEESVTVYTQVTRGVAVRDHGFPTAPTTPTVYLTPVPWGRPSPARWNEGWKAETVDDVRWHRVDIKTISLLGNVLAHQEAKDKGADEAIMVRDGFALEGARMNLFGVKDGKLITHPRTQHILTGITRTFLLELADELGIEVDERPMLVTELWEVDELFFTGSTAEVRPIVKVNGVEAGRGTPGPVTRQLFAGFERAARVDPRTTVGE